MSNKHIYVDLHLHTRCSDGVWEPERLFEEIRVRELEAFCVSDHDNLDAYPIPPDLSSRAIPGLEVDSHHGGHTAHILAYGVADKASPLLEALHAQRKAREARMAEMVAALNTRGVAVTMDDVRTHAPGATSLGRPHLARALVTSGAVATVQEAFDRYLADDGSAYVALERLDAKQAIALIARSGGVSIVAHPLRLRDPQHLEELIALGIDGIEVAHPTADAAAQQTLCDRAAKGDLLVTGGTDFHAPVPDRPIGIPFAAGHIERLRERIGVRARQ